MTATTALAPEVVAALSRFGLTRFRPGQDEVVAAVLQEQDCLCIMPTGGGKSLCYQLPAIVREGLTLVVSPLIALMKDQVDTLQQRGIRATFVNSSLSLADQRERLRRMSAGEFDLVYVAPERLRNSDFVQAVRGVRVRLLAIDEAHCVSEWGHDFRPDYAKLGRFRQRLGSPPTIALTATATPTVRQDIQRVLELRQPRVFITGFARPNLKFEVRTPAAERAKQEQLVHFLDETEGCGIVYAATRKRCDDVRAFLAERVRRPVGVYHAGLEPDDRRRVQEQFMSGRLPIIVATNAFGMGIDKADLRFVAHYNMPGSLEAYYQEAGRAGRDGQDSRCLLLYSPADRVVQEFFIDNSHPTRPAVAAVYEFLRAQRDDPIEITLEELKERLGLKLGSEGISACERLLEKCGVLERLDSRENQASIRIEPGLPTLVDLLPKGAKNARRVLRALEEIVGEARGERVYFHLPQLLATTELSREAAQRALRDISALPACDYVPPFRGRALHMRDRTTPFDQLPIDFEELERRRAEEYQKLDRVIAYAGARRCRQLEITMYFGDPNTAPCGQCDNCAHAARAGGSQGAAARAGQAGRPAAAAAPFSPTPDPAAEAARAAAVLQATRMALSGVARAQGRFGKQVVAQMLWGSKSGKLTKWNLHRLSTHGLLSHLMLEEVGQLLDALVAARLAQQVEIERFRPVLQLTDLGAKVMRGETRDAPPLALPREIVDKITRHHAGAGGAPAARAPRDEPAPCAAPAPSVEPARPPATRDPSPGERAVRPPAVPEPAAPRVEPPRGDGFAAAVLALRAWRREVGERMGWPLFRVMSNATLERVAAAAPRGLQELAVIQGVGSHTLQAYGADLLRVLGEALAAAGDAPAVDSPAAPQPASDGVAEKGLFTPPSTDAPSTDAPSTDFEDWDALAAGGWTFDAPPSDKPPSDGERRSEPTAASNTPSTPGRALAAPRHTTPTRSEPPRHAPAGPGEPTPDCHWTWLLLTRGFSLEECAAIRRLEPAALLEHLIEAAANGWFAPRDKAFTPAQLAFLNQRAAAEPAEHALALAEGQGLGLLDGHVRLFRLLGDPPNKPEWF